MKLGIAVNDLGASQLNFLLIQRANELVGSRRDLDIILFYENIVRPCLPMNFAVMQIAECWGFDGPVVATTFNTAEKLLRFPSSPRKLFYVWDLEWTRMRQKLFRSLLSVYGNPDLTLLARCQDHADAIRQCWNREALVVEDCDLDRIIEVAGK